MNLTKYLEAFLRDTVNINQHRLTQLDDRVEAVLTALKADAMLGGLILGHIPQGSWPQETIIKPLPGKEFDADFLLHLVPQPGWRPVRYIDELDSAFGRNGVYDSKRKPKNRCVRITYANDCHLDVVPFLKLSDGRQVITNHDTNEWEDTNPAGFTAWMRERDGIAGGDLRRVIRLLKYLRDYKGTFAVKSVILTTLVGGVVTRERKVEDPAHYMDLATSFRSIINDLSVWLDERPDLPLIEDPSCPGTDFNHRWDQAGYANFRDKVRSYAAKVDAAYLEPDHDKSVELWQSVFGEAFKRPASTSGSGKFGPVVPPAGRTGRGG